MYTWRDICGIIGMFWILGIITHILYFGQSIIPVLWGLFLLFLYLLVFPFTKQSYIIFEDPDDPEEEDLPEEEYCFDDELKIVREYEDKEEDQKEVA